MGRFSQSPVARAAGGVIVRRRHLLEVLVVHRPRFDDWTFPKGHVDDGESWAETAQREVREEAGVDAVAVGPPLILSYPLPGTADPMVVKVVAFFPMLVADAPDELQTQDTHEVDRVEWWSLVRARRDLTYSDERALLDQMLTAGVWGTDVRS